MASKVSVICSSCVTCSSIMLLFDRAKQTPRSALSSSRVPSASYTVLSFGNRSLVPKSPEVPRSPFLVYNIALVSCRCRLGRYLHHVYIAHAAYTRKLLFLFGFICALIYNELGVIYVWEVGNHFLVPLFVYRLVWGQLIHVVKAR